ncbi:hypothetical protein L2E82_44907 [Cichorium intybus]|uniref:Uncharacterized protein n=1 Tax=Cichorium intybus TaxID=13427 RepID=A0ACB8ZVY5_CICIN|nr:hypothetical protein L2E82_44907 [Cichorium intybus]
MFRSHQFCPGKGDVCLNSLHLIIFLQHFSSMLYCMYENYASNSPVFFLQKENHLSVQMDLNNRAKIFGKYYNNPNFGSR